MDDIPTAALISAQSHLLAARDSLVDVMDRNIILDRDGANAVIVALDISTTGLARKPLVTQEITIVLPILLLATHLLGGIQHAQLEATKRALGEAIKQLRPYSAALL